MYISTMGNEYYTHIEISPDSHSVPLLHVDRSQDFSTGLWQIRISWSAIGCVKIATAEQFKECLDKAIELAKGLENELQNKRGCNR